MWLPYPQPHLPNPYPCRLFTSPLHALPAQSHMRHMLPAPVAASQRAVTPEEGKGERTSRITHHLRTSSRHRSVSPQSHRFLKPMPVASADPVPLMPMRNLPLPPCSQGLANLLRPQVGAEGVVHSPRPMLLPKHSFTIDPITHTTLPKSERVQELEQMAEEVGHQRPRKTHTRSSERY